MKIAKTITHILFPVFIGLIIGGAIFNNTAAWVSGLALLIVDIIVGIAIQYFMQKNLSSNYSTHHSSNPLVYFYKVNKISKDKTATAFFTTGEIVYAIVNLHDAKKYLTQEEYYFVSVVFETCKLLDDKLLLNQEGFLGVSNEIMAHFDLIAPYYKFCGDPNMQIVKFIDDDKYEYRQKAKKLLKAGKIFQEEGMTLHKEFLQEFYS